MRKITALIFVLFLVLEGCELTPEIIKETSGDNFVTEGTYSVSGDKMIAEISKDKICGKPFKSKLLTKERVSIGEISVANDNEQLIVTYLMKGDWEVGSTHLFVGTKTHLPVNNGGNPMIGNFPFKNPGEDGLKSITYRIPLTDIFPDVKNCVIVMAHIEASGPSGKVSAWGDGKAFSGASGATFFTYCIDPCNGRNLQNAFVFDKKLSLCFQDLNLRGNKFQIERPGFTTLLKSEAKFRLYANVIDCDPRYLVQVGTVTVKRGSISTAISYELNPGWYLREVNTYLGSEPLPGNKISDINPDNYPHRFEFEKPLTRFSFKTNTADLKVTYMIAHAVVQRK